MSYAVCIIPIAPIRVEPNHKAEMVSQLLFGEFCIIEVLGSKNWAKIICTYDGYTGWCQLINIQQISKKIYNTKCQILAASWVNKICINNQIINVPFGSVVNNIKKKLLLSNDEKIIIHGKIHNTKNANLIAKNVKQIAFMFLNTSYLWGGRSVFGVDCSGFTQIVFKFINIVLPRDASQQALKGDVVGFLQLAVCGDVAFFENDIGEIIHVGILLNNYEIIHAYGKVKIDKIDNEGIIDSITGKRTKKLRIIKRFF